MSDTFSTDLERELSERILELEKQLQKNILKDKNNSDTMERDVLLILTQSSTSNESVEDMLRRAWSYGYFEGRYP